MESERFIGQKLSKNLHGRRETRILQHSWQEHYSEKFSPLKLSFCPLIVFVTKDLNFCIFVADPYIQIMIINSLNGLIPFLVFFDSILVFVVVRLG